MTLEQISSTKMFGGWHNRYTHFSTSTNCTMTFAVYLPPQVADGGTAPAVYWLSGLTCTDKNFSEKAGAQRVAAELGLILLMPDTSPRGEGVPDDPDGAYDMGLAAGFYINATQDPWKPHYQMYDYIVSEFPALIDANFPVSDKRSICGHSMGGHGALMIGLKNPGRYESISAFAPISNPVDCPWGEKVFSNYLGDDRSAWEAYDSALLLAQADPAEQRPILVDQGTADGFLAEQLKPERLSEAAEKAGYPIDVRMQDGYDHSYFFIATFIEDHLRFHAKALQ